MATRRQRYYQRARTVWKGKRYNKGGFGVYANGAYFAGAGASLLPINLPPIAQAVITGIAVAPVKLPYGIKMACQGFVSGKLIQQFTGNPLAAMLNGGNNSAASGNVI